MTNLKWSIYFLSYIMLIFINRVQASNSPIQIISSDENGIVLEIFAGDVTFIEKELEGQRFFIPAVADFDYTLTPGAPQVPMKGMALGIPHEVDWKIQILEIKEKTLGYKRIYPHPKPEFRSDSAGLQIQTVRFHRDANIYQRDRFYPSAWVEVSGDGMLRHQRVIRLQVNPVRVNPITHQVIKLDFLKIRLDFIQRNKLPPSQVPELIEPAFEKMYRNTLLNYDSAKKWRSTWRVKSDAAFKLLQHSRKVMDSSDQNGPWYKLFIEADGIYRLDTDYLSKIAIDWQTIDPRTIKIFHKGIEQAILVYGQEDGLFDSDDKIDFYAERNKGIDEFYDPYTDINVYWLTWGGEAGKRMPIRSSLTSSSSSKRSFKRTLHLEEDLSYYHGDSGMEIMITGPVDGEGWIWRKFNGGLASPKGDYADFRTTVTHLVLAEHSCQIRIRLRGTTLDPVDPDHHAEISINNHIIGDTTFNDQAECIFVQSFSSEILNEGENIIRVASIPDLGAHIDQFYLDWIELDYLAQMKPINSELTFQFQSENAIAQFILYDFESDDIQLFDLSTPSLINNLIIKNIAFISIEIISAGYLDGNKAQIFVNGIDEISGGRRGHNLVVLDETTGIPIETTDFDTWLSEANADSMAHYISALPQHRIVLVAIRDDGSTRMTGAAHSALEALGSQFTRNVGPRDSWALIGRKGARKGSVPEVHIPAGMGQAVIKDTLEIEGTKDSYSITFSDSLFHNKKYIALTAQSFKQPNDAKLDSAAHLKDASNGADYIIITHKNFTAAANRLASYRAMQNGLRTKVVFVEDIYDEFNSGLLNPKAIRDFLKYAFENWQRPAPSNVVLLGDASWDFKKNRHDSQKENYVPSYGNPVSDTWFVSFDDENDFLPDMFVGRIPLENTEQVEIFLDKLIHYEASASAQWKKDILFITGGKGLVEQSRFKGQSEYLSQNYVIQPPASCSSTMIHKTSEQDLEGERTFEISTALNQGKLWVNFLGHAGSRTWDLMFNDPDIDALINSGKYPFITSMTCHTARFANPVSSSFSEHFLFAEDKGAIGFWGTAGWGFIEQDYVLLKKLFPAVLADTVHALGQATTIAKIHLWQRYGGGAYNESTIHQYTLLGDPLTDIALPEKPDLTLRPQDISIYPFIPVEADSSVRIKVRVLNWGLTTPDSLAIDIIDVQENQEPEYIMHKFKIKPVGYSDSLTIPWNISNKAGNHIIRVILDPQNQIEEVDEDNNQQEHPVTIYSSALTISKPIEFQVVATNSVVLQVNNPILDFNRKSEPQYEFQLDTTETFDSPLLTTSPPITESKVVTRWQTPALLNDITYFWRCRTINGSEFGKWVQQSFTVDLSSKEFRWLQHHPVQFTKSTFKNTEQMTSGVRLAMRQSVLQVESAGAHDGNNARIFINFEAIMETHRGHNVAIIDRFTQEIVATHIFDTYLSEQNADSMAAFLNQVKQDFVVCIGIRDEGSRNMTEKAYVALESLGSQFCRNVGFGDSWAFISIKGHPERAKEMHQTMGAGFASVTDTVKTYLEQGHFMTPLIGPGNSWIALNWSAISNRSTNDLTIDVLGLIQQTSQWDTVRTGLRQYTGESLTEIDRELYAKIKIRANLFDNSQLATPILESLDVAYEPVADLAISHKVVHLSADTVMEGESIQLTAVIYNVGQAPVDSANIRFSYLHPDSGRIPFGKDKIVRNLGIDSAHTVVQSWNSTGHPGRNQLFLEIDSDKQVRELFDFNNSISCTVHVVHDTVPPSILVTYDGKEIVDGDLVSVSPIIEVQIKDNGPLAIRDTSAVDVYLNGKRVPYSNNESVLQFIPNSNQNQPDLKALLHFAPQLADKNYTLEIFAKDASGNRWYYRKDFQVISEFKLLSVLNYPNPFEQATHFTYTLTQPADWVSIKIYTIAGRLIRTIDHASNEIGYNQEYWDGLDEEVDEIANGVYLYKIIAARGDEKLEVIQKLICMR